MAFLKNMAGMPLPDIANVINVAKQAAKQVRPDKHNKKDYQEPSSHHSAAGSDYETQQNFPIDQSSCAGGKKIILCFPKIFKQLFFILKIMVSK